MRKNKACHEHNHAISKGRRHCQFCGEIIVRGQPFYRINVGRNNWGGDMGINVCEPCSWIPDPEAVLKDDSELNKGATEPKTISEKIIDLGKEIPDEELEKLPTDLSKTKGYKK